MTDNKQLFNQPDTNPDFQEKNIDKLENQQPQAQTDENAESKQDQSSGSGMGARIAGAAVGGVLGARSGGIVGAVAGSVAGAMIGKGTADTVNRAVDNLGDAANTVADGIKDTVEELGTVAK